MLTKAARTFPPLRLAVSERYRPLKNGTYSTGEDLSMASVDGIKSSGMRNVNWEEVPTLITEHNRNNKHCRDSQTISRINQKVRSKVAHISKERRVGVLNFQWP